MRDKLGRFVKGHKEWLGKKRSQETISKMSAGLKGKVAWNKGKKTPLETKQKQSLAKIGKPSKWIGKKHKLESIQKMRISKLGRRGANCVNWKGGRTEESKRIRRYDELKRWRKEVFLRDNWTCKKCNKKGVSLVAHHIKNFCEYPELRTQLTNGITFCTLCHVAFHKKFGFTKNNQEQINNYLINESIVGAT